MSDTKLIELIEEKRFEEARKIIREADDKEALISATHDYNRNALHWAIWKKAPDDLILEMIGAGGAAVFGKDGYGRTPLHDAVIDGVSFEVLKALIVKNPDALDEHDGKTPRDYLCENNLDERSMMLVKKSTSEIRAELLCSNEDKKEERIAQLEKEVLELKELLEEGNKKTVDAEKRNKILQQQTRNSKEELLAVRQSHDKINAERTEQIAMKEAKIVDLNRLLEIERNKWGEILHRLLAVEKRSEVDMNKWGERFEEQIAPSQKNINRMMEIVMKEQTSPMREESIIRELLLQSRLVCFLAFMTMLLMLSFYRLLE